jgi:two-component system, NtrC family, sensor kinase
LSPPTPLRRARLHQQVVASVSSHPAVRQGDVLTVCHHITSQVAQLLGIERVSVWLFNAELTELVCQDLYLLSQNQHSAGAVLKQSAFADEFAYLLTSKHLAAHDPYNDPRTQGYIEGYLRPNGITAMLDGVIRLGEEPVGTLCLEHVNRLHRWTDDEITFVTQLGDQVALTVSLARSQALTTQLQQRDRALQELNEQLERRVEERSEALRSAQQALLDSERLAALGSIVAGVAHELSTPLGNARMTSTTLSEHVRSFAELVASGRLMKSALVAHLQDQQQCADLIERNLQAAVTLIEAFKSVSVDQASGARRKFALHQVVRDVLETLGPTLQRARCDITFQLELPTDLEFDSYPGPVGQLIVNFVNNAILHGFEGRSDGRIRISATRRKDGVRLVFADNGCGIAADRLGRVFEPFYTTKLGKGGSGLGLHLVYNLVTKTLGGQIAVGHAPGGGAAFTVDLPLRAPA